jgi:beta-phosphoglucomutase-like phosphatase (HAD superfamily)
MQARCRFLATRAARAAAPRSRSLAAAAAAAASASRPLLVTFDVDGTLIHAVGPEANRLHKRAFSHAFKEVYGVSGASIDEIEHHGSTDLLVTLACMRHRGLPLAQTVPLLPRVAAAMVAFCEAEAAGVAEGLHVLPGVEALLAQLAARPGCLTGLVTGNLEPIGWAKMEALGLKRHFSMPLLGGFSSDYCSNQLDDHSVDRAEFIRVALRKAQAHAPAEYRLIHFGDTPNDIKAAVAAGALPVGLATGAFTKAQLSAAALEAGLGRSCGQDAVILDDLRDTSAVLRAMGL